MSYLSVRNWKNHQHRDLADKGNMPWLKLDAGIFDDPAIAELNAYEFRAYIRALTLAARTGNKLPANAGWLRAHFGRSWFPVCSRLVAGSLLDGALPPQKALQSEKRHHANTAPTPRLEEKREEKRQEDQPLPTTDLQVTQFDDQEVHLEVADELEQRRQAKTGGLMVNDRQVSSEELLPDGKRIAQGSPRARVTPAPRALR